MFVSWCAGCQSTRSKVAVTNVGTGEGCVDWSTSINSYRVKRARYISYQTCDGIIAQLLRRRSSGKVWIERTKGNDLVVRGPVIANDGRTFCDNGKGVSSVGIDCPEPTSAHKCNYIATKVFRAACS